MWTITDKQASICWLPVLLGTLQEHLLVVGGFDEQSFAVAAPATSHQQQHFDMQKMWHDRLSSRYEVLSGNKVQRCTQLLS
jgi:hypothetical protein